MAEGLRLRIIRDFAGIEKIREVWSAWHSHPNSDIDFYLTILRSMPGEVSPYVIVLYRGEKPRALLVGRLEKGRIDLKFGYKTLLKPKARVLTFIYKGLLGDASEENTTALVQEVIDSLKRNEADAAMLGHARLESPLSELGLTMPGFLCRDHGTSATMHRSMALPMNMDGVYAALSKKSRTTLKSKLKKFAAEFPGQARIRTFRGAADFDEMMRDIEQVAAKTYQRGLGVGFDTSAAMRERLQLEIAKGWLRAFVLYIGDKPVAFWIGKLYQNSFCSDSMGYDPAYGKHSPGIYLIMHVVEYFCGEKSEDRAQQIDFGFGDAQYKTVLANQEWQESSIYIFAPSWKGIGINLLRMPTAWLNHWAQEILGKTSLLVKVKRMWRDRIMKPEQPGTVGGAT
ncbi:MAG: GNAT family N-acetyltransferase [Acidobacteriia bacterium]|nr:GNAT family N-acetyltransferase [Terriglobia bacterium]